MILYTRRWFEKISEGEDGSIATRTTSGRSKRKQRPGFTIFPASAISATTADADADDRGSETQSRGSISHSEANLSRTDELVDRRAALKLIDRLVSGHAVRIRNLGHFALLLVRGKEGKTPNRIEVMSPVFGESPIGRAAARAARSIDQVQHFLLMRAEYRIIIIARSSSGSTIPWSAECGCAH